MTLEPRLNNFALLMDATDAFFDTSLKPLGGDSLSDTLLGARLASRSVLFHLSPSLLYLVSRTSHDMASPTSSILSVHEDPAGDGCR